jgi:cellulose synthase/poly-beta-1,6-N-acetylglucosamine synthase-like glycosyltransferase
MNNYYFFAAIIFSAVLLIVLVLYFPRIKAWFGFLLPYEHLHNEKHNRLCILVPARNESEVISPLLESLSRQSYKDFEVFVIVKDPHDPTIAMVKAKGFHVHVEDTQTCKSDALDGVLQDIISANPNSFDAYIILDADTMIHDDYLEEMNNAMASGRDVVVSKKIVKNYFLKKGSLSFQGAANGYIWTTFDEMGNRYKSLHHIALFTVGSGVLISKKIILRNGGFPFKATLTEDCELAGDIIANHDSSYYAPYAPIYMEEAPSLKMTNKRRNRWMSGLTQAQLLYRYKDFSMGSFADNYYCYSIFISYLYFALLSGFALGNGVAALVHFFLNDPIWLWPFYSSLAALALIYLSFFAMGVVGFFASKNDVKGHWAFRIATLFILPFHYLGYFPIMAKVFAGKGEKHWDEIARVKETR